MQEAWDELIDGLEWISVGPQDAASDRAKALLAIARDLHQATDEREAELVAVCDAVVASSDARPPHYAYGDSQAACFMSDQIGELASIAAAAKGATVAERTTQDDRPYAWGDAWDEIERTLSDLLPALTGGPEERVLDALGYIGDLRQGIEDHVAAAARVLRMVVLSRNVAEAERGAACALRDKYKDELADLRDQLAAASGPARCAVCGWPQAMERKDGCVPGDCSMRPRPSVMFDAERAHREADPCRRCSECMGEDHHWQETGAFACKHCSALVTSCADCGMSPGLVDADGEILCRTCADYRAIPTAERGRL